jgi:hypothetical protein
MSRYFIVLIISMLIPAAASQTQSQTRVLGEVTAIDATAKKLVLKDLKGQTVSVMFGEKAVYQRIPPEETTLANAVSITLAEVGVGDRVRARGVMNTDGVLVADALVVMTKADITRKSEHDRAEWLSRGIVGIVQAVNAQTQEITLVEQGTGNKLILTADAKVHFRRYAPDSIKFRDAKQSSLAEVKVGDQLRALGVKSADGARFTSEEIVFGTFRTVGGIIAKVAQDTGEITISDIQTKQPLTVIVSSDSILRRLSPASVKLLEASVSAKPAEPGTRSDLQQRIEASPTITVAELKPGDGVLVSSSVGSTPNRVTAMVIAAGVDEFLKRQTAKPAQRPISLELGLPAGMLP